MIYIQKRRTPEVVKKRADEIKNAPENAYANLVLPNDSERLRDLFEQMPKTEIRNALYMEQHGICAYCMQKIEPQSEKMKIEHYKALSDDKELALDYQNYLGVCYGGEKENVEKPHILCCDAARKAQAMTINPRDRRQMDAVAYQRNGEIFIRKDKGLDPDLVDRMQNDLDRVLCLNGKKDSNGRVSNDTASKLIANRRRIYDSVSTQFKRWSNDNKLTVEFLQDKIEQLENMLKGNNIAEPFIGVRLYFYKRKQEKLRRQGL